MAALNSKQRGHIKRSAVRDINRPIRAIRDSDFWRDRSVELKEISHQKVALQNSSATTRMTRSRSKKQEEGVATEESSAELSFALENMHF